MMHPTSRHLRCLLFVFLTGSSLQLCSAATLEPIPDKLVVLTFDDSVKSQFDVVRPLLLRYNFGATFFITEGFEFLDDKQNYMTWEQIAQLHRDGFEIGNHTRDHLPVTKDKLDELPEQLDAIRRRCEQHGVPAPTSFAYPGNATTPEALSILADRGIRFARRGGMPEHPYEGGKGFAYEPGFDHPLLIPSAGDARPDWELQDFVEAVEQARHGRIAVLQFHGVPDRAHPWVNTLQGQFELYMDYLAKHEFKVIAMRDLARYVDPLVAPRNHEEIIQDRMRMLKRGLDRVNYRTPPNERDLEYWLRNMYVEHAYALPEIGSATGLSSQEVQEAIDRFGLERRPAAQGGFRVLPYPGGRHPRIGFKDGAIRPQRDTKCSIFAPWSNGGYVVADVPEAIFTNTGDGRELLYLAHTHVPTRWTRQEIELEPGEWTRLPDGVLKSERLLPNGVRFGATVTPEADAVRMEIWLTNGTDETLTGLRVQNCVMLKAAPDFNQPTTENRLSAPPYAACRNAAGDRWLITAWEPFLRTGGNEFCPCLHSDPQFPDCRPGQTVRIHGRLSFYEGDDIQAELRRIDATGWRSE